MRVSGLLEAAIYGDDLSALERFYVEVFGLEPIARTAGRNVVLRAGRSAVILFDARTSSAEDGPFPPHGTAGPGHIAFVVPDDDLSRWRSRLEQFGVAVEREIDWPEGGTSLYVRDPAGNSIELAPPSLWGGLGQVHLRATAVRKTG
jgi:catechol 2,3-dioxygenase-like lactoylglutathione lyase family enzyme